MIVVGKTNSGKTTLVQALLGQKLIDCKTQSAEYYEGIIDLPGEYLENPRYYGAIITLSQEASCIILVHDVTSEESCFPPNFGCMFNARIVGVITKLDLHHTAQELTNAEQILGQAGASEVVAVSAMTDEGLCSLKKLLNV